MLTTHSVANANFTKNSPDGSDHSIAQKEWAFGHHEGLRFPASDKGSSWLKEQDCHLNTSPRLRSPAGLHLCPEIVPYKAELQPHRNIVISPLFLSFPFPIWHSRSSLYGTKTGTKCGHSLIELPYLVAIYLQYSVCRRPTLIYRLDNAILPSHPTRMGHVYKRASPRNCPGSSRQ